MKRVTKQAILDAIRPLRETIEQSLTFEGEYRRPAPVTLHGVELSAYVLYRRGSRTPFSITYVAKRDGVTLVELSGADSFAGVLVRFWPPILVEQGK